VGAPIFDTGALFDEALFGGTDEGLFDGAAFDPEIFDASAAPAGGALVWNASSLPIWATLSNGDRSLSGDYSGELGFAVTTASRSSGKWYAEIVVDEANSDGTAIVGIVSQAADSSYPGDTAEGVGWFDDGTLYGE
jgi:hypothetical protein